MAAARGKQIGSEMGALFAADRSLLNFHLEIATRPSGRALHVTQPKSQAD